MKTRKEKKCITATHDDIISSIVDGDISWRIDLINKKITRSGVDVKIDITKSKDITVEEVIDNLNNLYVKYITSRPSSRDLRSEYFTPIPYSELSEKDLIIGESRNESKLLLELYILLLGLRGFTIQDLGAKSDQWFWKGDSGIIITKDWLAEVNNGNQLQ